MFVRQYSPQGIVIFTVTVIHIAMIWWMLQISSPVLQPLEFSSISGVIIPQVPMQSQMLEPPAHLEESLVRQPESPVEISVQPPESEPIPEPVSEIEPEPIKELEPLPEPVEEPQPDVTAPVDVEAQSEAPVVIYEPRSDAAHLNNPLPVYPRQSKRRKEEGTVLIDVLILADGSVGEARLKQSSGYVRLDKSALSAVEEWRYVPAMQGDKAVDYWYEQPVVFALR